LYENKILFSGLKNIKDYHKMKITRDELLIAAFKLFMSVNYEKASFAELGKMLGMSKAGIFKYYKNKQELFIAVVDKFCFSAQNPRNKFTETNGTFAEFIDEYVKGVQRTMDMLSNLIGPGSDKVVQGKFSYHAQYFHFLFQLLRNHNAPNNCSGVTQEQKYLRQSK